ncbi:MAG TPA: class I SAM-dependent methyltransferase [Pyrinomonadaceae bacterium]|nr:class I SAM-dependent methyltransferase [Pyrinomonadaceae bacterium]
MPFSDFPKVRPTLPPEYQKIYVQHIQENRRGQSRASRMSTALEEWMHRRIARDARASNRNLSTLEIGAGTLNHLPFESRDAAYDIVEPARHQFDDSAYLTRVRTVYNDIKDVPPDTRYDRIISIASFEHICNLPEVVAHCGLLLKTGGVLRAAIPTEGGPLWKLGWKLTTGWEFRRRYGLDYEVIMRAEHVNTWNEVADVLNHFFRRVKFSCLGLSRALSFYQVYICSDPDVTRCSEYLSALSSSV